MRELGESPSTQFEHTGSSSELAPTKAQQRYVTLITVLSWSVCLLAMRDVLELCKRYLGRESFKIRGSRCSLRSYGDSMILAKCIFSQSATGEVSSAYFRKLAISRGGECKFSQTGPQRRRGSRGRIINLKGESEQCE